MNPALVKAKLYRLALKMNPQQGTLNVRTAIAGNTTNTDDGPDVFASYSLNRLVYRELTSAEMAAAQTTLADVWRVWTVLQADLDQASAPIPTPLQTLTVNGTTWVIERVAVIALGGAYECMCRKTH